MFSGLFALYCEWNNSTPNLMPETAGAAYKPLVSHGGYGTTQQIKNRDKLLEFSHLGFLSV